MSWKQEGTSGEGDIGAVQQGTEADGGNPNRQEDVRYDPFVLFSEIKANDWRIGNPIAQPANAEGVNHPAVMDGGIIRFFEPVPSNGHSNFAGDQGGAKVPWPCRTFRLSVEVESPPTTGFAPLTVEAALPFYVPSFFPPVGAVWADIVIRGRFSQTLGDVPMLKEIPVSQMGGGGGASYDLGGSFSGTGHNMVPDKRNGFPLPDELVLTPDSGNALKAWIALNPADVGILGTPEKDPAKGLPGWGTPLAPGMIPLFDPDKGWAVVPVAMPLRAVKLNFWGQRGINIRAGKGSMSAAAAKLR